jgi:hypothetical protein
MEDGSRKYGSVSGELTITTSGTPVPLGGNVRFKRLTVQAKDGNVANIKLGASNLASGTAIELTALMSHEYTNGNLKNIFVDGANTEGVTFEYEI